jgi:hypothetical protein
MIIINEHIMNKSREGKEETWIYVDLISLNNMSCLFSN